jgi:hypothetical protein
MFCSGAAIQMGLPGAMICFALAREANRVGFSSLVFEVFCRNGEVAVCPQEEGFVTLAI